MLNMKDKPITTWAEADAANVKTELKDRKKFTSTRRAAYGNFGADKNRHADMGDGCRQIINREVQ
tara:strand:+ start:360 stop:554 length:195 start_codon:yes stop_codon:yes gene_type:complete